MSRVGGLGGPGCHISNGINIHTVSTLFAQLIWKLSPGSSSSAPVIATRQQQWQRESDRISLPYPMLASTDTAVALNPENAMIFVQLWVVGMEL